MKLIKSIQVIIALIFLVISISCKKGPEKIDSIYISEAKVVPELTLKLDGAKGEVIIKAESSLPLGNEIDLEFVHDESLITQYNQKMKSNYIGIPASQFTLSNNGKVKITKGSAISENLIVTVNNWSGYDESKKYMIPIRLKKANGGLPILEESSYVFIVIAKTIQTKAMMRSVTIPEMPNGAAAARSFTVEGRFNLANTNTYRGQVSWSTTICHAFNLNYLVFSDDAREGEKRIAVRMPDESFLLTDIYIDLRKWYHFALTYEAGNVKLYLDGVLLGSKPYPTLTNQSFTLGHNNRIAYSEFRVWSKARTQNEIAQNVCITNADNPDLLAYWRFNQLDKDPTSSATRNQFTDLSVNKLVAVPTGEVSFIDVKCPE